MSILEKIRNRRRERLKKHFERYRRIRRLLQKYGDDIIHSDNFRKTKAHIQHGNMTVNYVRMKELLPDLIYEETGSGRCYYGSALMNAGLPMPLELGEYPAYQFYFSARV